MNSLANGAGDDTGEALLQSEEGCFQTAIADGREYHGYGEGYGVAQ
jgi:hypothetical protein